MWEIFKHKSVKVKRKLDNMDQVMDIAKLNEFDFFYQKSCGIWITIRNFGSRKQEPKTESRNLEGCIRCLWIYNCFMLFQYKQGEDRPK